VSDAVAVGRGGRGGDGRLGTSGGPARLAPGLLDLIKSCCETWGRELSGSFILRARPWASRKSRLGQQKVQAGDFDVDPELVFGADPGLVLGWLRRAMQIISRIIQYGASFQNPAREDLVVKLQGICSRCEKAYSQLLKKLRPVKDAYFDDKLLSSELKKFSIDKGLAKYFKPEVLCSDIDKLLDDLNNYLKPLRYSIDINKVKIIRDEFMRFNNLDITMKESFDRFCLALGRLADDLGNPTATKGDRAKLAAYARHVIEDFEEELIQTLDVARKAKDRVVQ
jgi:hypothetical protein